MFCILIIINIKLFDSFTELSELADNLFDLSICSVHNNKYVNI